MTERKKTPKNPDCVFFIVLLLYWKRTLSCLSQPWQKWELLPTDGSLLQSDPDCVSGSPAIPGETTCSPNSDTAPESNQHSMPMATK